MSVSSNEIIGAVIFALVTAIILLPLARHIPASMARQWDEEVRAHLAEQAAERTGTEGAGHFAFSKGESAFVIVAALVLGDLVMLRHGFTIDGAAWSFYFAVMLLLTLINLKHQLLPDVLVLSCLWVGLLFQTQAGHAADHVYGAAVAFIVPWVVLQGFKRMLGGMPLGAGDLKALSMAGAWFGVEAVFGLLMFFTVSLVLGGIALRLLRPKVRGLIPSGPAHLFASLVLMCSPWLRPLIG